MRRILWPKIREADLLIISGDVTDRDMSLGDLATKLLIAFFTDLFQETSERDIPILLLRGTLSHDRHHLRTLEALHETGPWTSGFHYRETVSVLEEPKTRMTFGFLPDNLPYATSDAAVAALRDLMEKSGWEHLDHVLLHGTFDHLAPNGIDLGPSMYREDQFSFVRGRVLSGHVHTPSLKGKVLMNGSFDRLCHGEEDPKGFFILEDDGTDVRTTFIENTEATGFKTLRARKDEAEDVLFARAAEILKDDRVRHLRYLDNDTVRRQALGTWIKETRDGIRYTHGALDQKPKPSLSTLKRTLDLPEITEETLPALILEFLKDQKHDLTEERVKKHLI